MTRMSREFSLVLLGAGLLTAGYFAWPEQDFEKRADEQARQQVGGGTRAGHYHGGMLLFLHAGTSSARPAGMASVSRGGFGGSGARIGGGIGG